MEVKMPDLDQKFLSGGGEMGMLIRKHDWANTTLGSPEFWPQSLRITLGILLNSKFPMFLWWGPELICLYNDAYRPSLGENGKHPSILGMKAHEAWPEIWGIIKPLIDQVLLDGEATWSEDQLVPIFRNGKIEDVYWTFSYSPVRDESGTIGGILVICTETTDNIHTLYKLEESKSELEFAIEATELGTWDYNPVTNKFTSNKRLKEWFGLAHDQEIDLQDAINVIVERDRECVREAIQKALEYTSGGHYDIEYTIQSDLMRKEMILHAKGRAWFNDDKMAYRFNGTLEDVTEKTYARRKLEKTISELDQNREKLNIVIESSGLGNWELNVQTDEIYYSDRYLEILGYPKGTELTHQQILNHVHPHDLHVRQKAFEEAFQTGEIHHQLRIIHTDGAVIWIEKRGKVFYDDEGRPLRLIGTLRDITNEKQITLEQNSFSNLLKKQVQERTQELERKNVDLQKMNKELESFAYISSHDLQEPLRKIQTFATRIIEKEQHNLSDTGKDYFRRMQESAMRMQALIIDLLAYSRMNIAERKYEIVDLNEIIEEVKSDLTDELEAKHATIEATHMCHVKIIPFQFQQLLHNLFTNSLKFSSPDRDPHIVITSEIGTVEQFHVDQLDEAAKYCHISVADNGIGFEQEYSVK
ncbi:MAG: PAS domain-containing protein, partial [Saprospiraceae bacterium]